MPEGVEYSGYTGENSIALLLIGEFFQGIMIASLRGAVVDLSGSVAIVDVGGVGYEVHCSTQCAASLEVGSESYLTIFTDVREDQIRLYGFADRLEKQVFSLLTQVSGVGAKTAVEILSHIDKTELLRAVAAGDLRRLQAVRGVGKKTSERILVELKDRVGAFALEQRPPAERGSSDASLHASAEAIEGLIALGFPRKEAERLIEGVSREGLLGPPDSASIIREALRRV